MDGEIVYEVRLDGSKITSDMAAIEERLAKEAANLSASAAAAIGQSMSAAGTASAAAQDKASKIGAGVANAPIVGGRTMTPMASGADFIPSDNFPALLHKGEAVLTAPQNIRLQAAGGIGGLEKKTAGQTMIENKINLPESMIKPAEPVINVHVDIGGTEIARVIADATNARNKQLGVRKGT
jgi:hypothetical protein